MRRRAAFGRHSSGPCLTFTRRSLTAARWRGGAAKRYSRTWGRTTGRIPMNAFRVPLLLALAAASGGCASSPARPLAPGDGTDSGDSADAATSPPDDAGTGSSDLAPPGPPPLGGTLTPTGATFKVWA